MPRWGKNDPFVVGRVTMLLFSTAVYRRMDDILIPIDRSASNLSGNGCSYAASFFDFVPLAQNDVLPAGGFTAEKGSG